MKIMHSIKPSLLRIFITIIIGTLMHFIFDFSGKNAIIAALCPVNESVWEHLKLLFYPVLVLSIDECIAKKVNSNFILARTISIVIGMLTIVILYYAYTWIFGKNYTVIDIAIYIISVFITYGISAILEEKKFILFPYHKTLSIIAILIIITLFTIFTYNPPKINLFRDQSTNTYSY